VQDIEGNWFWLDSKTQETDKHRLFRFLSISIMFFCVLIIVYVIGECTTSKHQQVTSKKEWLEQKRENSLDGFLTSCKKIGRPLLRFTGSSDSLLSLSLLLGTLYEVLRSPSVPEASVYLQRVRKVWSWASSSLRPLNAGTHSARNWGLGLPHSLRNPPILQIYPNVFKLFFGNTTEDPPNK
jgi:hypothetical protein